MTVLPWLLIIVLSCMLCGVLVHNVWRSRGGTPLQALTAGGTAATALFGIGMAILESLT